jgi:hypothetical protein
MSNYLPMGEMKDGYLYKVNCRNASFGIWRASENSFVIRRMKFYAIYKFEEYHYDTGPPFGTAKPLKELELSPFEDKDYKHVVVEQDGKEYLTLPKEEEILNYLNERGDYYEEQ